MVFVLSANSIAFAFSTSTDERLTDRITLFQRSSPTKRSSAAAFVIVTFVSLLVIANTSPICFAVLREFGLDLPDHVTVRVHDSTADMRYIVLPARPRGTDGMTEADLAALVTRDSMIGTGLPRQP